MWVYGGVCVEVGFGHINVLRCVSVRVILATGTHLISVFH